MKFFSPDHRRRRLATVGSVRWISMVIASLLPRHSRSNNSLSSFQKRELIAFVLGPDLISDACLHLYDRSSVR